MTHHLCIRTDATAALGTGHLMRCLALAQAARDLHLPVTLITASATPPALLELWRAEDIAIHSLDEAGGDTADAAMIRDLAHEQAASWLIVDGYQFSPAYVRALRGSYRLACLDDIGSATSIPADCLINHNVGASTALYPQQHSDTILLLGETFLLLGRHCRRAKPSASIARSPEHLPAARSLLCFFGGSDSRQLTERIVTWLPDLTQAGWHCHCVIGATNPRAPQLIHMLSVTTPAPDWHIGLSPAQFIALARQCHIACVAAGSTCWELAAAQIPMVAVVTADNQTIVARGLRTLGCAQVIAAEDLSDCAALCAHVRRAATLPTATQLDGLGATRVLQQLFATT